MIGANVDLAKKAPQLATFFKSYGTTSEVTSKMLAEARECGFREAEHVSAAMLNARYFADRSDGLRTSRGEELLVART